ncbi:MULTISPECIES: hypothetical protein [Burkholderia cepacia complex]|uniref:hypothetical protein n=1 Tax=Burkholderia cepacia complex TaxID=87882 RepID=UPI0021C22542|nr:MULTISPECIES: hypothetical protein [Burkholderia cepacia complex]MDR8853748.1 hypothetical protein [Burkholderia pseudomultivorans]MDR9053451.1 hypothetical protein [Burkholderia multivorans]MDR9059251.1 hypothetical protein [Burkholderia multivorans]MDR9066477.1 hypothetical protein [Burkholderia multivorans]MDR9071065.1 hypothetical protein [Burkholderia multivorans]
MSKPTKRTKRAMKRAQRLEKHIDGIIDVLQQEVLDEVAAAERLMADLELEVAQFEMQHTDRVIH